MLAYATFFESWYGTAAVQECIYRSTGFAILLAFLGTNILCAALIRFPWKKRQTGFVITHAGLLVLLAGSYYSFKTADEGQVGMLEGETNGELVRIDYPVIRVRELDPTAGSHVKPEYEIAVPPRHVRLGAGPAARSRAVRAAVQHRHARLPRPASRPGEDVLADSPGDPFRLVVKSTCRPRSRRSRHVADPAGEPMARIPAPVQGARDARRRRTIFDRRTTSGSRPIRKVLPRRPERTPAQFAFPYVDRPELVDDFLNPPPNAGRTAWPGSIIATDGGRRAIYDWHLEGQAGKPITLPDSDLTVKFEEVVDFPTAEGGLSAMRVGEASIPVAMFQVRKGDGPRRSSTTRWASLPMFPNVIPSQRTTTASRRNRWSRSTTMVPPTVDPKSNGRFGQIEVLGDARRHALLPGLRPRQGARRGPLGRARSPSGKEIDAFGGKANQPMTITFQVEDYLPRASRSRSASRSCCPRARWATASRPASSR